MERWLSTPWASPREATYTYNFSGISSTTRSTWNTNNPSVKGTQIVRDAPVNYLQIYDADFIYASGWAADEQLMSTPATRGDRRPGAR
jgi:hypothetical protein